MLTRTPWKMTFEKVRSRKVPAIAAEQIVEAIQRGDYPIGGKLPSEAMLASQMGVSRASIREALSALEATAIIQSRQGSGSFVIRRPSSLDQEEAVHLIQSEAGCLEVMEARCAFEPVVAALVATKSSDKEIAKLRRILVEMAGFAAVGDFDRCIKTDKAFHTGLARAVGNPLISSAIVLLVDTTEQRAYRRFTRHYYLKNVKDLKMVVDLHREVLQAIEDGDSTEAAAKMRKHWARMCEIWET